MDGQGYSFGVELEAHDDGSRPRMLFDVVEPFARDGVQHLCNLRCDTPLRSRLDQVSLYACLLLEFTDQLPQRSHESEIVNFRPSERKDGRAQIFGALLRRITDIC